jgi:hypothetical protein
MVDPRTIECFGVSDPDRRSYVALLEDAYVAFALKANQLAADKAKLIQDAAKALDAAANAATNAATNTAASQNGLPAESPPAAELVVEEELPPRTGCQFAGHQRDPAIWSDDEDDDAPVIVIDERASLVLEFKRVFKRYRHAVQSINWLELYPDQELPECPDILKDLREVDLGVIFKKLVAEDPDRSKYGWLPIMATHSRASVGSLLASSYVERINSAANLIVTKGNTVLSDEDIDMCTTLRMNKNFMKFMRDNYNDISMQPHKLTVITNQENTPGEPDEP